MMSNCIDKSQKPILVLKGRGKEKSKLILDNKKRDKLVEVKLDGCYAKGTAEKCCDFMVQHNGINYYIELKGVDYKTAFLQLISAINRFNKNFPNTKCKAIIVTSKSPAVQDFQKAFRKSKLRHYICGEVIRGSPPHNHILS